jgi:hypothetical protein
MEQSIYGHIESRLLLWINMGENRNFLATFSGSLPYEILRKYPAA